MKDSLHIRAVRKAKSIIRRTIPASNNIPAQNSQQKSVYTVKHFSLYTFTKKAIRKVLGKIFRTKAKVDLRKMNRMVDTFMSEGFNYFDTAHTYLGGMSETALRECLVKRYPRNSYVLANKLSYNFIKNPDDVVSLFEIQLRACGVYYFDFYMIHGVSAERYEIFQQCRAFETAIEFKRIGKIKHFGMSFHDSPELLEQILKKYPEIEFVQIQLNYADIDSPIIQGMDNYKILEKYNKPVIVMEPVKGGVLVNLPDKAKSIFDNLNGGSYASYAIRYAASFPNVILVLSGMGNIDMVKDNTGFMKDFQPLTETELTAINTVRKILKNQNAVPCTSCHYCIEGCPKDIPIPEILSCINRKIQYNSGEGNFLSSFYYGVYTKDHGKASDCIKCGKCEKECPQRLAVRDLLARAAGMFEYV